MYNVSNVVLCAEVTYRAYFVVIKESKLKHWTITLRILKFILHYRVSKHNSYSFLLNLSTLLCCIDTLKLVLPWWRLRKGGWDKAFIQIGS